MAPFECAGVAVEARTTKPWLRAGNRSLVGPRLAWTGLDWTGRDHVPAYLLAADYSRAPRYSTATATAGKSYWLIAHGLLMDCSRERRGPHMLAGGARRKKILCKFNNSTTTMPRLSSVSSASLSKNKQVVDWGRQTKQRRRRRRQQLSAGYLSLGVT